MTINEPSEDESYEPQPEMGYYDAYDEEIILAEQYERNEPVLAEGDQPLQCPNCGGTTWNQLVNIIMRIPVRVDTFRASDGEISIDYAVLPGTNLNYDTDNTLGLSCAQCGNQQQADIPIDDADEAFEQLAAEGAKRLS